VKGGERYPLSLAILERLMQGRLGASSSPAKLELPVVPFTVGPAVLRAPPEIARGHDEVDAFDVEPPNTSTDDMLGELVDMVFVSAEENHGEHEVHLVFKAEVLGGLHMKLVKKADGMHATFVVEDAAARRAVVDHVDGLVAHLKGRGFSIASHTIEVAP
jgi:hypothetical protein